MPRRASSSIQRQKGLPAGTSANTGTVQAGGLSAGSRVRSRNTDICSRVTAAFGQNAPIPQPVTTARRAISSIQRQKGSEAGTSSNIGVVHAGGTYDGPSLASSTNTAICARVIDATGQYRDPPQPPV